MANRAVVGSVLGERFRCVGSGLSRVGGPQARKDFITETTKNHGDPLRRAKTAAREAQCYWVGTRRC